ncbi:MAG: hypothetical protein ACT4PN_03645 [Nitrospiraceae bacterium]
MAEDQIPTKNRLLAQSLEELKPLHQLCREGRLYEVERWISDGRPLQVEPATIRKGTRPKTALQIAIETGQHSLTRLLLSNGYQHDLERYRPLDLALEIRRWDLFDLLLEGGADLKSVDVYTVLNTYNTALYERFRAAGYDLTIGHHMASILGHGTSNRPLLGFVKRYRSEDPKIQSELNLALRYQVRKGNERGVALCLWAGADPHVPASDTTEQSDPENGEEPSGWSAIEEAASEGHLAILQRLRPDPARDKFDDLYRYARYETIVSFLSTIQKPNDIMSILSSQLWWVATPLPFGSPRGTGVIEAVLSCGVRWEEQNPRPLNDIRRSLLKLQDYGLRTIVSRLKRPEICAPETYQALIRTPNMQARLLALGLWKKPVSEAERRKSEVARLLRRYDRAALYDQVWSRPACEVATSYGISGVMLGKVCRKLMVPVPPRGYWARVQNGQKLKRPALPKLS